MEAAMSPFNNPARNWSGLRQICTSNGLMSFALPSCAAMASSTLGVTGGPHSVSLFADCARTGSDSAVNAAEVAAINWRRFSMIILRVQMRMAL